MGDSSSCLKINVGLQTIFVCGSRLHVDVLKGPPLSSRRSLNPGSGRGDRGTVLLMALGVCRGLDSCPPCLGASCRKRHDRYLEMHELLLRHVNCHDSEASACRPFCPRALAFVCRIPSSSCRIIKNVSEGEREERKKSPGQGGRLSPLRLTRKRVPPVGTWGRVGCQVSCSWVSETVGDRSSSSSFLPSLGTSRELGHPLSSVDEDPGRSDSG